MLSSLIAQNDVDEHEVVRSPRQASVASVSSSFKTAEGCAVKDKRVSAKIRLRNQKLIIFMNLSWGMNPCFIVAEANIKKTQIVAEWNGKWKPTNYHDTLLSATTHLI